MAHQRTVAVLVAACLLLALVGCSDDGTQAQVEALNEEIAGLHAEVESLTQELAEAEASLATAEQAAEEARVRSEELQVVHDDEIRRIKREAAMAAATYERAIDDLMAGLSRACSSTESDLPPTVLAAFTDWLRSNVNDPPDDLAVTVVDAAGRNDQWTFHARFNTRYEPGIFLARPNDTFVVLFGGMGPSAAGVWTAMQAEYPNEDLSTAACIDIAPFVDTGG